MKIEVNLNNNKAVIKETNNLVNIFQEFDPQEIESVVYTEGDITTFAKPAKIDNEWNFKVTGKYNNRTGEFEYV